MAWRVHCARAARGLRRPSLDARSWGLIQVIREKRIHASLQEHLCVFAGLYRGEGASRYTGVGWVRRTADLTIL